MKKTAFFGILLISLFVLVTGAPARSAAALLVNIPFDFYVGKELLPAGDYRFEMGAMTPFTAKSSSLLVRRQDGSPVTGIFTIPGSGSLSIDTDRLHFNRYGNKYFLARIECLEFQADLRKTSIEKELRAQTGQAKDVVLVAER
jgi:hypothetical protein